MTETKSVVDATGARVAVVDELQSVIALLRDDLSEARQKCTMLELQVHDSENKCLWGVPNVAHDAEKNA